ncbi:AraC family transcriptional regulator [Bacillus wiedmannii]|nr:AraC family transcriptional regulator [Bacillus wiedmannii]PGA00990.1 AraC family transcriptional regulator [Bacillus wiedmannii]PHD23750.1 AraC family transcriptional regulator [Bacillus wiedmannii]
MKEMNAHIQQMIDWIESNLKEEFSLNELSRYMRYSPYYCSFKFHQVTGISIRRYVLLRKMYLSTVDLKLDRKIIDVAFDYGYSSQEAYSRAFKNVFGMNPRDFKLNKMPIQSFVKLNINKEGEFKMNFSRKLEVEQLRSAMSELFENDVLNILNGQMMYEEFKNEKLMGDSEYAPFNEAMCVNLATTQVFNDEFIKTRAEGHNSSVESYTKKVIDPLKNLFTKKYKCIVLWFGEDMFCQINLLTILSYLEQSCYEGKVYLNSFREDEFKVNQIELELGNYSTIYNELLVNHKKTSHKVPPVMYQAIDLYLEMLKEDNIVMKFISKNQSLSNQELLIKLFQLFPTIGYGDFQYIELINKIKKKAEPKI